MILEPSAFFVSALSIIFGIIFIFTSNKLKKSAENDILKNYFKWVFWGSIAFTLEFIGDLIKYFLGETVAEPIHHLFLIVAVTIFAVAGFILSKEFKRQQV